MRKPALLLSTGFHVVVLLLLLTVAALPPQQILPPHKTVMPLSIRYDPPRPEPPGGSGQQSADPAPESPAPRPAPRMFRPLLAVNDQPQLPVQMILASDPGLSIQMAGVGDFPGIPGNGGSGLIGLAGPPGDCCGRGKGPGDPDGFGRFTATTAKITRPPQLIYKEEPEYSEDARKAHIQGTVRLTIDVGLDGRASNIRVVQSVGLGLDENAIEAVRKWRFRPALSGDRPVVAPAVIDVGFFLL